MSKAFRKTLLGGAVALAGVAAIAIPVINANAEPASGAQGCEPKALEADGKAVASSISSDGRFAAGSVEKDGTSLPVIWDNGEPSLVEVPDDSNARLTAVNSSGQAVGEYIDAEGKTKVFVVSDGKVSDLESHDQPSASAHDINDDGTIVGSIAKSKQLYYPVVWSADKPSENTPLEVPNEEPAADAISIDSSGNIAGHDGEFGPMVWKGGEGEPESLNSNDAGGNALVDYNEGWALSRASEGGKVVHYLHQEGEDPVEFDALPDVRAITSDGFVLGMKDNKVPMLVSPEGEEVELSVPDGADFAQGADVSNEGTVAGNASKGDDESTALLWACR